MSALRREAKGLSDDMKKVVAPPLNLSQMRSSFNAMKAMVQSIRLADFADLNATPGQIMVRLMMLKRMIAQAGISDILDVNVNESAISAQLAKLGRLSETIPVNFKVEKLNLPGVPWISSGLTEHIRIDPVWSGGSAMLNVLNGGILNIAKSTAEANAAFERMHSDAVSMNQTFMDSIQDTAILRNQIFDLTASIGGGGGGGGNSLTRAIAGAGGWIGRTFTITGGGRFGIGGAIGGISLWHIAIDLAIEALIAITLAAAAAATGIALMTPTVHDLGIQLHSIQQVNSALGSQIPPLTGQFSNLAAKMAPQTIEIYGAALNIVSRNTGALGNAGQKVVTLFDTWAAKIVIWSCSQLHANGLLAAGIVYLSQFGRFLGTLGMALGNLIKADPGVAHFLLDILQGAAGLQSILLGCRSGRRACLPRLPGYPG